MKAEQKTKFQQDLNISPTKRLFSFNQDTLKDDKSQADEMEDE